MKPAHYALSIHDIELGGAYSYQGTVKIDIAVKAPTKELVLNSHELKVNNAEVIFQHEGGRLLAKSVCVLPSEVC